MFRVLVVDDDLEMLALVRAALEKDGHRVDIEPDAAAVQAERCQAYDLLLLFKCRVTALSLKLCV